MQRLNFSSCRVYGISVVGRCWTVNAEDVCKWQQHRSQWIVIHSKGNKVTKMGRLITCNTGNIQKPLIMAEQYLWEQMMKGTSYLEVIFTYTNWIEHSRMFNPYTARTLVNTSRNVCAEPYPLTHWWHAFYKWLPYVHSHWWGSFSVVHFVYKGLRFFLDNRGHISVSVCSFCLVLHHFWRLFLQKWWPGAPEVTLIFVKL